MTVLGALLCVGMHVPASAQRIKTDVPVRQLEAAAQKDRNDAVAHYNLALGYWSEKKYDQAEAALKEAVALEPRFALAYLAQAMLPFARRGELWNETLENRVPVAWRDAVLQSDRLYRMAFMMNPLVELRILGAVSPKKSYLWDAIPELSAIYNEWLRGFDDFRDGEYAGAYLRMERLAQAITETGRSRVDRLPHGVLWYRGLAAAHVGNYEASIRDLRELLRRAEQEDEARLTYLPLEANSYRYALASVLQRAMRMDEAAALYREILTLDAGAYIASVSLANILEQQGELDGSVTQRQAAAAANPEDFLCEIELAVTLAKLGRKREAEEALERAAAVQPRSARPWYLLGLLQQADGRPERARQSFTTFLELAPSRFPNEIQEAKRRITEMGG